MDEKERNGKYGKRDEYISKISKRNFERQDSFKVRIEKIKEFVNKKANEILGDNLDPNFKKKQEMLKSEYEVEIETDIDDHSFFPRKTSFLPYFIFFDIDKKNNKRYTIAKFSLKDKDWSNSNYPNNYNIEVKEGYEDEIKNLKQKLKEIVYATNNYARSIFKAEVMDSRQKGRYTHNMYEEIEESVDNMFNY